MDHSTGGFCIHQCSGNRSRSFLRCCSHRQSPPLAELIDCIGQFRMLRLPFLVRKIVLFVITIWRIPAGGWEEESHPVINHNQLRKQSCISRWMVNIKPIHTCHIEDDGSISWWWSSSSSSANDRPSNNVIASVIQIPMTRGIYQLRWVVTDSSKIIPRDPLRSKLHDHGR